MTNMTLRLERIQTGAAEFLKRFPEDPRRWDAKAMVLSTNLQLAQVKGRDSDAAAAGKEIDEILASPDASKTAKGLAMYLRVQQLARGVQIEKLETMAPLRKAITEYLETYSTDARAQEIAGMQIQVLQLTKAPDANDVLKKMADSPNPQIASMAKSEIEKAERMAALKTQPVDLKFTSVDGKAFDLEKLRGKVVLLDFWASWCGPCIVEMPNVVGTYQRLKDKGFEIVGISLDQDKEAMEQALKKHNMTWIQHFDGKGWQNEVSTRFGIDSIPATWLIDKKGMLRETGLRGEELGKAAEKLLAE